MYTAGGSYIHNVDPHGSYHSSVDAGRISSEGGIRVLTFADGFVFAMDTSGATAWSFSGWDTPGGSDRTLWNADVDGDGELDWMYREDSATFVARRSGNGEQLFMQDESSKVRKCELFSRRGRTGMLVTLIGDTVTAFTYAR